MVASCPRSCDCRYASGGASHRCARKESSQRRGRRCRTPPAQHGAQNCDPPKWGRVWHSPPALEQSYACESKLIFIIRDLFLCEELMAQGYMTAHSPVHNPPENSTSI